MSLFRSQGIEQTTMEGIAEKADVAKRTLYSYFPVKEAIISAFWLSNVEEKTALLPRLLEAYTDTHSRLTAVFLDAAEGFKREPEFARIHFCYQFQEIGKQQRSLLENDFMAFLIAIIEAGQNVGELRHDICKEELAAQIMFNFTAVCLTWFSHPKQSNLDARLRHTVECFINGAVQRNAPC